MKDKGNLGTIIVVVVAVIVLAVVFAWGNTEKKEATTETNTATTEEQTTDAGDAGKLSENEVSVTSENFEEKVVKASSGKLVVVDVYAPWCPHCQKMGPITSALADEYVGQAIFGKMNADNQDESVKANFDFAIGKGLEGYPTFWFYKDGKVVFSFSGEKTKDEMKTEIEKYK